jgi:hypothetical protein
MCPLECRWLPSILSLNVFECSNVEDEDLVHNNKTLPSLKEPWEFVGWLTQACVH